MTGDIPPLVFHSNASVIPEEKDLSKFTSFASVSDLKSAIPTELLENSSLLPFAGNLFVVGIANKNGDCLNPEDVFAYYKQFKHTRVTLEHKQETIIGHIVDVGFSRYDPEWQRGEGSQVITEEEARALDEPFNCWVAGAIYKENAPAVVKKIIDSNDPESDNYLKVSLSWEIRFYESEILLGSSVFNGKIVTDSEKKASYLKYLKSSDGRGTLKDGTPVNRLIIGDWTPLGAGCTLSPAASVKGIVIPDEELEEDEEDDDSEDSESRENETSEANIQEKDNISENNEDKSSLLENTNVIKTDNTNIIIKKPMKYIDSYASFEKLTDEDIKSGEISIANLQAIYKDAIKQADATWQEKVNAEKTAIAEANQKIEASEKALKETKEQTDKLIAEVKELKDAQASAEVSQKFQTRMAAFNEKYELNDSERAILARNLQGLSDEDYDAVVKDYEVLFAAKDKAKVKEDKEKADKAKKDEEEKAKGKKSNASVTEALSNASVENPNIPNNPGNGETLQDKHKEAFSKLVITK